MMVTGINIDIYALTQFQQGWFVSKQAVYQRARHLENSTQWLQELIGKNPI